MSARDTILQRIRDANQANSHPAQGRVGVGPDAGLNYRRQWNATREAIVARFIERLSDYHVGVLHAPTESDIGTIAERRLHERGIASLVIPLDLPAGWRPQTPSPAEDTDLSYETLDSIAGVMTGCFLGIAETGTIILNAGATQGRRALTLLPDYHLCVVREAHVVGIVPEAMAALAPSIARAAPITFFSGPSATADIELDRVEGVHGPRTLDVILVA
jgi:L-lactate dehydrogenase complex protein LldG